MSHPTPREPGPMEQRVSHEERDQVVEVLRVAAGDGRLSLAELEERLEACLAARTYADLAVLVADLPGQAPVGSPVPRQVPKDLVRAERVGGNLRYQGTWLVPKRLEAEVLGGNVLLDFTSAIVAAPVTEVDVRLRGGNVRLVVPDGYAVDADEVSCLGGSVVRRRVQDPPPDVPAVHRVVVTGQITGGNLVITPPKPARRPGRLRRLLRRG